MTLLLLALLTASTIATGMVLADNGLRLWSALGEIGAQRALLRNGGRVHTARRERSAAGVAARASYVLPVAFNPAPEKLRAAA